MRTFRLALAVALAACGAPATPPPQPPVPTPVAPVATVAPPAAPVAPAAPAVAQVVDLPGNSNGVYWDAGDHALYLADSTGNQLLKWTDAGGLTPVGPFPSATRVDLGGVARAGAMFVVPSFGFGSQGAVYTLTPGRAATALGKLDMGRSRLGVAVGPDHAAYVAYFTHDHSHAGGVERIDLATGAVTDVVTTGLHKPVGVAATATTLYVSDQDQTSVFAYPFAAGGTLGPATTLAKDLQSADLLAMLPDGSLVTGGKRGVIYQIRASGETQSIASGFDQVRGVAYDADGRRLLFVEHGKTGHDKLHVLPLELK